MSTLYEYFTTKGKLLTLNSPKIAINEESSSKLFLWWFIKIYYIIFYIILYSQFKFYYIIESDIILDEKKYHTAGWDAYFAGYIYIKMAHIFCVNKFGTYGRYLYNIYIIIILYLLILNNIFIFRGLEERRVTHAELISSIKNFVNCINITRGNEMYMVRRYIFLSITKI